MSQLAYYSVSNPMSDTLRHEERFLVLSELSFIIRVKAPTGDASTSVRGWTCPWHVALRSCRHSSASTAAPHGASSPAVVNAPHRQLRSVAHYVADRGAVIPRSTPIVRRRSWDCAVAPEGINRREGVNSFPLRSLPSFSFASSPLHA